jgi:exodeoxyribonuclease III
VNGIRARFSDLRGWLGRGAPDILCLQEIKATGAQVPEPLTGMPEFWNHWHGQPGGYSGVSLHLRRASFPRAPTFASPPFDFEHRITTVELGNLTLASIYVPNGNKDLGAKIDFLRALIAWAAERVGAGRSLLLCGDLNVARSDADLHPVHRNPRVIGQTPAERDLFAALLDVGGGLVDVLRAFHPNDDTLFTWWPPWREEKRKNRGWRIDYVLATRDIALQSCAIEKEIGTSDHAPFVVDLELPLSLQGERVGG